MLLLFLQRIHVLRQSKDRDVREAAYNTLLATALALHLVTFAPEPGGVAQVSEEGGGMQVYAGRRVPLVYWDVSGEDYRRLRLSSRPIPIPGNTQSWTVLQVLA